MSVMGEGIEQGPDASSEPRDDRPGNMHRFCIVWWDSWTR